MRTRFLFTALAIAACMMFSFRAMAQEAYAECTSIDDSRVLTFYYDDLRSSRTGVTYDLNADTSEPGWVTAGEYSSITKVVFDPSFADARPHFYLSLVFWL